MGKKFSDGDQVRIIHPRSQNFGLTGFICQYDKHGVEYTDFRCGFSYVVEIEHVHNNCAQRVSFLGQNLELVSKSKNTKSNNTSTSKSIKDKKFIVFATNVAIGKVETVDDFLKCLPKIDPNSVERSLYQTFCTLNEFEEECETLFQYPGVHTIFYVQDNELHTVTLKPYLTSRK